MVVTSIPPSIGPGQLYEKDGQRYHWSDLAALTVSAQEKYCALHGYDHHLDVSDATDYAGQPLAKKGPAELVRIRYGVKFLLMQHYMTPEKCGKVYDHVVWVDGDLLPTNYNIPLTKFMNQGKASTGKDEIQLGDLILPFDCNSLHPTVIMARCTTKMRGLMFELTGIGQRTFGPLEWSDNFALRFAIDTPPYREAVWWHSAKDLCAQHPGLYPIPSDVRAEYDWTSESWALHLSALPLGQRIEIAKDYCDRLGLLA
jgi:hypothetical protein